MSDSLLDKIKALIASEESTTDDPPTETPKDGEAPPAWAQQIVDRLEALEAPVTDSSAAGGDKSEAGGPDPSAASGTTASRPEDAPTGAAPPASTTRPGGSWTSEQLEQMTPDQINEHWPSILAQWQAEER